MKATRTEFQPKRFYRKLDELLHEIRAGAVDGDWFARLMRDIVEWFGDQLYITNGRVYTEEAEGFRLDRDFHSLDPGVAGFVLPTGYGPLQLVLDHGVYLFDESVAGQDAAVEGRLGGLNSAAILIESNPRRILAFGLEAGWERVHLDFALNTIRHAINQRVGVESLKTGIAQAAEIQRSLLPPELPRFEGYSIAARSVPAEQGVGGDFYDFLPSRDGDLYVALGDVSGHGLPAALLARDVVTGLRMGTEGQLKITAILERLNRVVHRSILSTRFVSLFFANLEDNGNLFYINAGHFPPWIFGDRGTRRLRLGGMILGPLPESHFKRGFDHLDRGDSMVICTDGVLERTNSVGVEFGVERLEEVAAPLAGRPAEEILEAIYGAACSHGDGTSWDDDTTLVVITRNRTR